MIEDIQAAIPLGLLLSFMVGPVFFVLLETGATKGFRAAISLDIGVVIADTVFILIAYFSSFQLIENLSNQKGLYVFGGSVLFIYGMVVFLKKAKKEAQQKKIKGSYVALVVKGFLLNFINVGVLGFWLGILVVVGPNLNNDENRIFTFFLTMIITYFLVDIVKILLAKQLKRKLTPKRIALMKKGLGIILMISGLVLIISGFLPKDNLV